MLPATKATAQKVIPVYGRPIIQSAFGEALNADAQGIVAVVRGGKAAIRAFLGHTARASTSRGYGERTAGFVLVIPLLSGGDFRVGLTHFAIGR